MATILLSAAGAALGAGFGGTVLGLSGAVIGRAIGATLGRVIDQRLMGAGSEAIEVGRVDRFRLMGASEGSSVAQVWGRMRVAGQVIWATEFQENARRSGGKGAPRPSSTQYSYSVSLAVALCEGQISRIGRIWADGLEIAPSSLNYRVYTGSEAQLPDPKIAAVEGAGLAPSYRGIAYVVIEDLELASYGNRVPQFTFEVVRPAQGAFADDVVDLPRALRAVALVPGTGEYALATTAVHYNQGLGVNRSANVNSASGKTDFATSLDHLRDDLPNCGSVSLVVSWFGDDLRCGVCKVQPKVEQNTYDGVKMPWKVSGVTRAQAVQVPRVEGNSIYGGTPTDKSVIEAIQAIRAGGQEVMFYPFILMDQIAFNGLPDPASDAFDQPVLPWRGRMTLAKAPGQLGSTDRTAAAEAEVAAFFGGAQPAQFSIVSGAVQYSGPVDWKYRRFILHYAKLCALAGGVDAFCIGSEMRGMTQIRGVGDSFPVVQALRQLAADVRDILGSATKISYAADWTEYFGYQTGGDVYFNLDPLWADPNIDFVGIDNYMPASDWRDGEDHADADEGAIYSLGYLKANIGGGEGFDWYYDSPEGAAEQVRLPITDGAYGEPWVFRYKDLSGWWSNLHHDRTGGLRALTPSDWVPGSKPIWFTEYGCAAIDKGANQPNRFIDVKSSESGLPAFSNGRRDDLMQMQYLHAQADFWGDGANNPVSLIYNAPMVDMSHAHAWAWDARPFPEFPGNPLWSDGENYARGHWLNGRTSTQALASVVAEICEQSGVSDIDVAGVFGLVRGYSVDDTGSARAALQPLMLAYGFEAVERDGALRFKMRDGLLTATVTPDMLARSSDLNGTVETTRAPEAEMAGRIRLGFIEGEGSYEVRQAEAVFPDETSLTVSQSDMPLVLTTGEARSIAERWLTEARVARDTARFALPKSALELGSGDVVSLGGLRYRIDRVEQAEAQLIDAVRVEAGIYQPSDGANARVIPRAFTAPVPVFPQFMDLPLLIGDEVPHAPHIAVTADPWPGSVAVWSASADAGYEVNVLLATPAIMGLTETVLSAAPAGLWDRGPALRIKMFGGSLSSSDELAVLNGANVLAIGDGSSARWEIIQFTEAVLVAPSTYELSLRLRGQQGSDGIMPLEWPVGSMVVLLDQAPQQIDLAISSRGLARYYRVGSATRGYEDPAVVVQVEAFDGIGLRPYPVSHLTYAEAVTGDVAVSWIRRTRIDGDNWQSVEVPLGEDSETYQVRVLQGEVILREETVAGTNWLYTLAARTSDAIVGPYRIDVAQVSDRFGAGPFRGVAIAA
jgi:GTA TIM-barrel-like domain/Putative phage tail protein